MHFRHHRHGARWEAFAEALREQIQDNVFSSFGDGAGPRGRRGGGRGRGRVLDSAELRLVLLKLIWEEPRHGYELIKAIEGLSGGAYAPSPGMVYPTLTMLADVGEIEESPDGSRKRFTITDAGAKALHDEAEAVTAAMARLEDLARINARADAPPVRRAMRNLHTALGARLSRAAAEDEAVQHALQLDIAAILDEAASRVERL